MFSLSNIEVSEETAPGHTGSDRLNLKNLISEESFRTLISVERKRTERSGKPFMVMMLDVSFVNECFDREIITKAATMQLYNQIAGSLVAVTRDIDIKGWHQTGKSMGILFTEISKDSNTKILEKVRAILASSLPSEYSSRIGICCHWYPTESENREMNKIFYPETADRSINQKVEAALKRSMDIMGSLVGLLLFSPVFLFASILIKFNSRGPVFFRQERVGKGGKTFRIYKFRTMTVRNDESEHREFMKQFIRGQAEGVTDAATGTKVFKLTNDARVTPIGKFLRKTSLDEVPQFINVLLGNMSLVGPRPPIPYEVQEYDLWHLRRVLESKPGITGYWQVEGRSITNFDEMTRMDIRYTAMQSALFDLKVILKTPLALFTAKGAY